MNHRLNLFFFLLIFSIFFFNNNSYSNTQRNIEIKDIIVKNNQRIDTETIISYLNIDPGDPVNYQILNMLASTILTLTRS